TIQCASNQRQIGITMQIYANDHDDKFIYWKGTQSWIDRVPNWRTSWAEYFFYHKYISTREIFICPAAPSTWAHSGHYVHYGYNIYLPYSNNQGSSSVA